MTKEEYDAEFLRLTSAPITHPFWETCRAEVNDLREKIGYSPELARFEYLAKAIGYRLGYET